MGKKNTPPANRLNPAFVVVLRDLLKGGSVNSVAIAIGASQGHLNDQKQGKKPITLEALDQVARYKERSATQLLTALRDAAQELDRTNPGWDALPTTPLPGVVTLETGQQRRERVAHAKRAQAKSRSQT